MSETLERLRQLSPDRFAALVEELISARFGGEDVRTSPPSPAGAIDIVAREGRQLRLYHVRQYEAGNAVGVRTLRELVEFRDRRGAQTVTLLTTGDVSPEARDVASQADVTVLAGEDLAGEIEASNVSIPSAPVDGAAGAAELAERFASHWPEQLRVRADVIVDRIEECGDFEHRVQRADASTQLEFLSTGSGRPLVKVRFTETSLLVFVWDGRRFDRVVVLTVRRERPPDTDTLLAEIQAALDGINDSRRS